MAEGPPFDFPEARPYGSSQENPVRNVESGPLVDPADLVRAGAEMRASLQGDTETEPEITLIRFELGGEQYAIRLEAVTKIERVPSIVAVPRTPPFVKGIASLRGEVVCVVDLRALLGAPSSESAPRGLLVLGEGPRRVAILSDVLPDYFRAKESGLVPAPHRGGDAILSSGFERDEGFVGVIDSKKLMDVLERRFDA
ncbi:chemotaxis protein CheW [bacterium]|nr:chemotaxis protein CheW [bacterium]